jgi:hypothetical protein
LLPNGTTPDTVSLSQMSQRQNMTSSQDEMSLGYSQATQATPLTFFSADLSFKSHDNQDVELTQYLQGLEDEISGDVGQEVELVAHAPMFDDERPQRHSQQNRQRQHHGGIPAYSRSTPPRHQISGGSRIGGSISSSTGVSDSDRRRKRRSGSHIPSNSGKVQLDLSTLGGGGAASVPSSGGDAPVFVNNPQVAPLYSSPQANISLGIACVDKLASSLQNSNRCPLSPMSPVYSLDLDRMSLCGTENISHAGGSIGGASLCNVFDDPSDGPVGTSNLMDMTMSVGSHPSSGGTYGSNSVNNYTPIAIGLGLHQKPPLDVTAQTNFGENDSAMQRMDMSVGSGTQSKDGAGTKSSSSGGSSSRSRRSGSPASIDKASADGNWNMEDPPATARTQDMQFIWGDKRDE